MWHGRAIEVGAGGIFCGRRDIVAPTSTFYTLLPLLHPPSGHLPYPFLGSYLYLYLRGSPPFTKQADTNQNVYNLSYPGPAGPPKNISVTNLVISAIDVIIVKPPQGKIVWCTVRQFLRSIC